MVYSSSLFANPNPRKNYAFNTISNPQTFVPDRNVIGAIDGTHILIPGPDEELMLAYYNYKRFYSILLLAIVGKSRLFRWFISGAAGSRGDSGVSQATSLYRRAQEQSSPPLHHR